MSWDIGSNWPIEELLKQSDIHKPQANRSIWDIIYYLDDAVNVGIIFMTTIAVKVFSNEQILLFHSQSDSNLVVGVD